MQSKLQELTDKLYNEGLSKGKADGDLYLENARKEASEILAKAREEAAAISRKAADDAADLRAKAQSDIRMASEQSLQATKKDIEDLLTGKLSAPVSGALSNPDFLKEIIRAVAQKFSATESSDISLVLPEKLRQETESWVKTELAGTLKGGLKATFSKKIAGGFTIGPADGSYFISLSDETFRQLIAEYLRPVTRKILFGE
ncbi:MAG: hypothetical protein MJY61_02815 [Bacteroidales bacterium]|nr:hypothetical protein [Bacteroidales bacterium]